MERRLAGVLTLVLAWSGLVVVGALIRPDLTGSPSAAPLPEPPPIGACVDLRREADELTVTEVSCTGFHDGEVIVRLPAGDPQRQAAATPGRCAEAVPSYLGPVLHHRLGEWTVGVVSTGAVVVSAPADERFGSYGWNACVLTARGNRYLGSVHNLSDLDALPVVLASCMFDGGDITCSQPHDTQQVGIVRADLDAAARARPPEERSALIQQDLQHGCTELAAELTGSADPSYGGQLAVRVNVTFVSQTLMPSFQRGRDVAYVARCVLTSDRTLLGSIVGLGDRPLPFAPA